MRANERRRARREAQGVAQLAWRPVRNRLPPLEVLDEDGLEAIHETSLRILEDIGLDFLHPDALAVFRAAGVRTEPGGFRVRLDRGLVLETVARAPSAFTLHARNAAHDVLIGGNHVAFAHVASAPNCSDLERGRRSGTFADYCDLVRLAQSLNVLHLFGGYPVEAQDLPPSTRHLDCLAAFVTLGDKAFHGYALGRARMADAIEIARIARGIDHDRLLREPGLFTVVNTSSPLRLDGPMIEGLIEMARAGQVIAVTPFTLAGAMCPSTLAGALAQQNAEALAVISLAQLVRPGTPVIYGGFTSNVDMRSGAPAFGSPEYVKAALASAQLARRYRLPFRSSNANSANTVDAQAAYESMMSLIGAVLGHANLVMHAAGWLEGGLCASFEKLVLDCELLQMLVEILEPIPTDSDALAFEAIAEVGPGGHFFGAAHTLARFERAFYTPLLSDWRNHQAWLEAGAPTAYEHANRVYKRILGTYEPPALDPAIREELETFVARRKEEGGAPAA